MLIILQMHFCLCHVIYFRRQLFNVPCSREEPELLEIAGCFHINLFRFSDKTRIGKSTDKLNDNQKKIIQHIEERGAITNKEVQNLLNVKDSRALKILKEMVVAGVLKKEGKLKGSYYKLK